jgi:hypothetical protein
LHHSSPSVSLTARLWKNKFRRSQIIFTSLAMIVLLAGSLLWKLNMPKDRSGKISISRIEGLVPATAFFDVKLPPSDDSLFVNFGDKSPLLYLGPEETIAAHIYFFPGVFNVSIQTRHDTIATTNACIRSKDWIGMTYHRQEDIPDHFYRFPAVKTGIDSLFRATHEESYKMGFDTSGVILTRISNYTPVIQNADEFIFEATFKNASNEKLNYCRSTQFQISGSKSMIRFKLVSPGCSLRVINYVSEKTYQGAKVNLSQFVLDTKRWNTVKLVNRKKQLVLYLNGKQIFSGKYQRSLGSIKGLFLEYEGAGLLKSCTMRSPGGKVLYRL